MNKNKCPAKEELEKIIERGIQSLDIAEVLKAHEYGCIDCLGFGYKADMTECSYYNNAEISFKLLRGLG